MNNLNDIAGSSAEQPDPGHKNGQGQACASNKRSMMCFNPKVLLGLGAAALGIWAVAPGAVAGALPLLFLAACPLSMFLMMWGMNKTKHAPADTGRDQNVQAAPGPAVYEPKLADLKGRLAELETEQESLAGEIADREASAMRRE